MLDRCAPQSCAHCFIFFLSFSCCCRAAVRLRCVALRCAGQPEAHVRSRRRRSGLPRQVFVSLRHLRRNRQRMPVCPSCHVMLAFFRFVGFAAAAHCCVLVCPLFSAAPPAVRARRSAPTTTATASSILNATLPSERAISFLFCTGCCACTSPLLLAEHGSSSLPWSKCRFKFIADPNLPCCGAVDRTGD